jgi:hypothetical protein
MLRLVRLAISRLFFEEFQKLIKIVGKKDNGALRLKASASNFYKSYGNVRNVVFGCD